MYLGMIQWLPYILLAIELFLLLPAGLYFGGKIMNLQHERFTFKNCIWASFIAGLLTNFGSSLIAKSTGLPIPMIIAIVFIILIGIIIKKQFQAPYKTIAVMVLITTAIAVGDYFLNITIISAILGIPISF